MLDHISKEILATLQHDGRITNIELAAKVRLSPAACLERVRKLEAAGYITGYTARVDAKLVGAPLLVFIKVMLARHSNETFAAFRQYVQEMDEVLECHLLTGDYDYLIKARVMDMPHYRETIGRFMHRPDVVRDSRVFTALEEVTSENKVLVR